MASPFKNTLPDPRFQTVFSSKFKGKYFHEKPHKYYAPCSINENFMNMANIYPRSPPQTFISRQSFRPQLKE